jgi:hypothetical protein
MASPPPFHVLGPVVVVVVVVLYHLILILLRVFIIALVHHMPQLSECGAGVRPAAAPANNPWGRTDDAAPQLLWQRTVVISRSLVVHPC